MIKGKYKKGLKKLAAHIHIFHSHKPSAPPLSLPSSRPSIQGGIGSKGEE